MSDRTKLFLADEAATLKLGKSLANTLRPGLKIYLYGDLGAGKTTLVRGMLRGLGHRGGVKSPTYALVELYELSNLYLYHFDFYRFNDPKEWTDAGFREAFDDANVCLVEWPERAGELLPTPDLALRFEILANGRELSFDARSAKGRACLGGLEFASRRESD